MREVLDAILRAHGLPLAETITRPQDGMNNPIYIINEALVIRFDGLTSFTGAEYDTRFRAEEWVYRQLHEAGLPVPEVLAVDERCTLAPLPYMLMRRLPGEAVIVSPELSLHQRRAVAHDLGQTLARMHNVTTFDRFGRWHQFQDGTAWPRWTDGPLAKFHFYADWIERLGSADMDAVRDMRALMDEVRPYLEQVTSSVITHRDAHPGNVLQADGRLTGLIDFEWWMAADPASDFAITDQWEAYGEGCEAAIYDGYTAIRPLDAGHHLKARAYTALRHFDEIAEYLDAGDEAHSREAAQGVRNVLNR